MIDLLFALSHRGDSGTVNQRTAWTKVTVEMIHWRSDHCGVNMATTESRALPTAKGAWIMTPSRVW